MGLDGSNCRRRLGAGQPQTVAEEAATASGRVRGAIRRTSTALRMVAWLASEATRLASAMQVLLCSSLIRPRVSSRGRSSRSGNGGNGTRLGSHCRRRLGPWSAPNGRRGAAGCRVWESPGSHQAHLDGPANGRMASIRATGSLLLCRSCSAAHAVAVFELPSAGGEEDVDRALLHALEAGLIRAQERAAANEPIAAAATSPAAENSGKRAPSLPSHRSERSLSLA